jgi:NADPH:quinone reductase-like Zn-dependent oxidoreductase
MATAILAKRLGMTVLATTRNPTKAPDLERLGVDHMLIDQGSVADQVHHVFGEGVDAALELIGTPTLPDTLRSTRVHGVVCFTGMLSNQWIVEKFYPIEYIPRGVRLTAYGGEAADLPPNILQGFINEVESGRVRVPIAHVYRFDEIVEAHQAMETARVSGKLVVSTEV